MNLAKLLDDAYPGESDIPDHILTDIGSTYNYCQTHWPTYVDNLFGSLILSIYEHGHRDMTDEEFLPIARDVLKSYKSDIKAMLKAVKNRLAEVTGLWVIRSTVEKDEETDEHLYWADEWGWVYWESATRYSTQLKEQTAHLPKDAEWKFIGWKNERGEMPQRSNDETQTT